MDINSNLSFKSIYRVYSSTNPANDKIQVRADLSAINVGLAMTKNRESLYSKKETKAIQNFFRIFPDYQKNQKVKIARANGDLFLLTGKDKDDYEKFDKQKLAELNEIRKNYHLSQAAKNEENQKVYNEMNAYFDSKEIQPETIYFDSSQIDNSSPITFLAKYKIDKFEICENSDDSGKISLDLNTI